MVSSLSNEISVVARRVKAALERLGLEVQLEQRSPSGNFMSDLLVRLPSPSSPTGYRVVPVEVDGPPPAHYARNDLSFMDNSTRWRNRHLQREYGVPVVTVNIRRDWEAVSFEMGGSKREEELFLMRQLRAASL